MPASKPATTSSVRPSCVVVQIELHPYFQQTALQRLHAEHGILTQVLADRAWVWITLGVVTLLGVWFVGETRRAAQARRVAAPVLQNRVATYSIAAVCLLVLALVAPLFARGWVMSLILLALVVAGVEVIRNIVHREAQQPS